MRARLGFGLVALAAALLGLAMAAWRAEIPILAQPDHLLQDWRMQWRGVVAPGRDWPLLLVRVDDAA